VEKHLSCQYDGAELRSKMSNLRTRQELMEEMMRNIVEQLKRIDMNDKIRSGEFMGGKLE
jgi:spore coat protein CotF